jgi:TRAP transporter 4TM/12TM fusion protein
MIHVKLLAKCVGIIAAIYHIIIVLWPFVPTRITRSFHLSVMITLIFLLKDIKRGAKKERLHIVDFLCIGVAWASFIYTCMFFDFLDRRFTYVGPVSTAQVWLGVLIVAVVFEACRRTTGMILPIISSVFIIYAFIGNMLPLSLNHEGFALKRIIDCLYLTTDAIFGDPINVSATYIFLFIIFGCFLEQSGVGNAFIEFANKSVGWARGGPAKVSVISSALFGTVSGSAVGNVAVTGTFTIPLMKRSGYQSYYAAAVEAAASAGGQIMPPVMGAAAFIMSEFIGVPYIKIVQHALIPSFLYYFGVFMMVDLEAAKIGMKGEHKFNLKSLLKFFRSDGYLFFPLIVLVALLIMGYTAVYAACIAMLLCIVLSWLKPERRMGVKEICNSLSDGAIQTASIAMTCACAGMVIGLISLTGVAVKFSMLIMAISDQLFIVLLVVMFTGLFLGMGLPTTPAYIIQAGLITPSLVRIGMMPIQAHMFVFYFAVISVITPPVCLASYTAATLADAPLNKTGWAGLKIAIAGFLVPFVFAVDPGILMIGEAHHVIWSIIVTTVGVAGLGISFSGYFMTTTNIFERVMFAVSSLLMIYPGYITDFMGIALFVIALIPHVIRTVRQRRQTA